MAADRLSEPHREKDDDKQPDCPTPSHVPQLPLPSPSCPADSSSARPSRPVSDAHGCLVCGGLDGGLGDQAGTRLQTQCEVASYGEDAVLTMPHHVARIRTQAGLVGLGWLAETP